MKIKGLMAVKAACLNHVQLQK